MQVITHPFVHDQSSGMDGSARRGSRLRLLYWRGRGRFMFGLADWIYGRVGMVV
jgi:hypothetical protein